MDYFLLSLAGILLLMGIAGCILPILPGPPLSYVGLLLLHFTRFATFGTNTLVFLGLLAVLVQILDYMVPVWGTRKFGGTKYGTWGSIIGLIAGMFFLPAIGPFGIITLLAGPFLGAFIAERMAGRERHEATRAALGSFIGFMAGTFMKLASSLVISIYFVKELIQYWK